MYEIFSTLEISKLYDSRVTIVVDGLPDLVYKEKRVGECVADYLEKQSKTYARIVQDNLYDLLHNLNKVESKIYGRKYNNDDKATRDEKLEALAKVQCDAYFEIGVLK